MPPGSKKRTITHLDAPERLFSSSSTTGEAQALEMDIASRHPSLTKGLTKVGMEMARRSLRLTVRDLVWQTDGETLILEFFLPAGAYATVVLRELVETHGDAEDVNED